MPESDSDLLRAFQRRERDAFDVLFSHHAPGVFSFARRLTGSCDDAEEIVTETSYPCIYFAIDA
jgi:DNA-directed RNA polymerase specialized sigma24 family protein